ncbi:MULTISPECIES: GtrA family protein [unclassified Dyella]|jgi:putative flippase GtrA|uniref:GtrA family protein n=1 Tax=unclassified Dyella TaxID=2634549 RepID=UPI003F935BDC
MKTLRQSFSYGIVGGLQIAVDWTIFVSLSALGIESGIANVAGRGSGAMLGFWFNGKWTFSKGPSTTLRFAHLARFLTLWTVTTLLSTLVVMVAAKNQGLHFAWLIKPIADVLLAGLGFGVSKLWIYR